MPNSKFQALSVQFCIFPKKYVIFENAPMDDQALSYSYRIQVQLLSEGCHAAVRIHFSEQPARLQGSRDEAVESRRKP